MREGGREGVYVRGGDVHVYTCTCTCTVKWERGSGEHGNGTMLIYSSHRNSGIPSALTTTAGHLDSSISRRASFTLSN